MAQYNHEAVYKIKNTNSTNKCIHSCAAASTKSDNAGLDSVVLMAKGVKVMLTSKIIKATSWAMQWHSGHN